MSGRVGNKDAAEVESLCGKEMLFSVQVLLIFETQDLADSLKEDSVRTGKNAFTLLECLFGLCWVNRD